MSSVRLVTGFTAGRAQSPDSLAVQQAAVLCDLQLQPGLDVQQELVVAALTLQVGPELHQLILHAGHLSRHTGDLGLALFTANGS